MIKFPRDLLFENIANFARGEKQANPLTRDLIDLDVLFSLQGHVEERKQALADTKKQEAEFLDVTTQGSAMTEKLF